MNDYHGLCPTCDAEPLHLNVGRANWCCCPGHGRWCIGEGLHRNDDETAADWQRNAALLRGLPEVEPVYPTLVRLHLARVAEWLPMAVQHLDVPASADAFAHLLKHGRWARWCSDCGAWGAEATDPGRAPRGCRCLADAPLTLEGRTVDGRVVNLAPLPVQDDEIPF